MTTKELIKYWRKRADDIEAYLLKYEFSNRIMQSEIKLYRRHAEELEQADD